MNIALVGPTDRSIWIFRRGLIRALVERGHRITVICSGGNWVEKIKTLGVLHIHVPFSRFIDPLADLKYILRLYGIFRKNRFDLIHNFTVKPNIYSTMAARMAGIRNIVLLIEGLGFAYDEGKGIKARLSRNVLLLLYRIACLLSRRTWFINKDDLRLFVDKHIITESKSVFIKSVGVDAEEYSIGSVSSVSVDALRRELSIHEGRLTVVMIGRMIWSKGVREFIEAADIVSGHSKKVMFLLVGEIQSGSPLSVPEEYLQKASGEFFRWLGFRSDVKELIALSDIVVLPSYYREGVPRSLLEAMSMGKPIVATDSVGCREVIEHGKNGFLVPIRDSSALALAIEELLADSARREEFGKYGREWIDRELDESIVVRKVLTELYGFYS